MLSKDRLKHDVTIIQHARTYKTAKKTNQLTTQKA